MNTYVKFGLLSAVVVGALGWLAVGGINETKTYFKTIPELTRMGDQTQKIKRLRAIGYVQPGSVTHEGHDVKVTLVENKGGTNEGLRLVVVYKGFDPLPDTFKYHVRAVADGKLDPSGAFRADKIQFKRLD
jgi:cytochrome c-type biogenesis protein CcmE